MCVLGPYYGIRRTGVAGEEAAALDLAREIEATYPGYRPIPPELGDEVVPDVAFARGFGDCTIHHLPALGHWESHGGAMAAAPATRRPRRRRFAAPAAACWTGATCRTMLTRPAVAEARVSQWQR